MPSTYLTVTIPYVNAEPHLGYAYELVQADLVARARRQRGDRVRFLGGTDDHSLKNVAAATQAGEPVAAFVGRHADRFAALAGPLGLSFDDFIRTSTDRRHRPAVERLWRACAANGDLYRRSYEGDYCVGCEQFWRREEAIVEDSDPTAGPYCPEHLTPLERVAEENWFFRLSAYQNHITELIESDRLRIHPAPFRDEVLSFVRGGLEDLCVSRAVHRARGWGIPVPGDDTQVVWVWFDALVNYLSALRFGDPDSADYRRWWLHADARMHVVGKGVIRPHAVYWPAFLASAGQPAPTHIEVHPYLTVDGTKLSKSAPASVPGPTEVVDRYGTDALRWWFAASVSPTVDTDFTDDRLVDAANAALANGVGNVVNRIVTLVRRYRPDGIDPDAVRRAWPVAGVVGLEADVLAALAACDLRGACRLITAAVDALNRDLEATQPWRLGKHEHAAGAASGLDAVLARHVATAHLIAAALRPVVPELATRLSAAIDADGAADAAAPVFARLA